MRGPRPLAALVAVASTLVACSSGDGAVATTAAPTTTVKDQSNAAAVTTTVFRSGEDGYNTFRIPAVVAARNGTLLAFAEGRKASAADSGQVDLVEKRSTDGGTIWGPVQVVAADQANFVGNPSPVVDRATGRVIVLAAHKNGADTELQILTGTGQDTSRVWLVSSDDNGTTWNAPRDITAKVKRPEWRWNTVGPGHAIQLGTGPHSGRLVAAANHSNPASGAGGHVLLSDDGGLTWRIGAVDEPGQNPSPDESTAAQLPDGTIVFSSRNENQGATWHRLRTTSTDGGETFAAPYSEQAGLVVPAVQGSLLWEPAGRLLFSAPSSATQRVDLRIRTSTDAGTTWSDGTLIAPGPAGYSDLVALPDGRIGNLHEAGTTNPYERIDLTVIGTKQLR